MFPHEFRSVYSLHQSPIMEVENEAFQNLMASKGEGGIMEKKAARWWDKLGKPQYGGEMVIRINRKIVNLDPYKGTHPTQIHTAWMEKLFVDDWTLDPEIYDYRMNLPPNQYVKGHLAETWDLRTHTLLLSIYGKGYTGRTYRRQTAVSLSLMTWPFTFTDCMVWAVAIPNPARVWPTRQLLKSSYP